MDDTDLTTAPTGARLDIEVRAREMADLARGMADKIEADRRLPAELVSALRDSGLLRAGAPVEVGALELPAGTALRCGAARGGGARARGRWVVWCAPPTAAAVAAPSRRGGAARGCWGGGAAWPPEC